MNPLIYVVIVNYNNIDDLVITINSFKRQNYFPLRIIVVDNGSKPEILGRIEKIEDVSVLANKNNLGWAAATNMGIQHAMSQKAEYVILANNDIFIDDYTLINVLINNFKKLGNKSKAKILGTRINDYNNIDYTHNSGKIFFNSLEKKSCKFNRHRLNYIQNNSLPEPFKIVDFVEGCFMMIECKLFNEIGFFKECFFMYFDETEFCYRAWQKGYPSIVNKSLVVYHKIAKTAGEKSPFQVYYLVRNEILFFKNFKKDISFFYKMALFYQNVLLLKNILFFKKKKKYEGSKYRLIKAYIWAHIDAARNNTIKRYI